MTDIHIDWSSADVQEGRLTVAFGEKPEKEWVERLAQVVDRLARAGSGWSAIEVGMRKLHVDGVEAGAEQDLRHFLESAVLQANADQRSGDEPSGASRSEEDQARTDAFRAFAQDDA